MILNNIADFTAAVPTTAGMDDFSDFEPYVSSAELWIKNKVLGKPLYDQVNATEFADADLLKLCRSVIANHAYWDAIPFLDLVHTGQGFAVISATNKVPASKERVERLREQCLVRRDSEVENLISYLEQHPDYHDAWKGSPVYSVLTDCLITTADEMRLYANWEGDRRQFLALRPKLIHFTIAKLQPVFSRDLIESLIEKQRDGDLTADEMKVLVLLKHALGSMIDDRMEIAKHLAADALRMIDENLLLFPIYTASKEYTARTDEEYVNEQDSTIFSSIF